MGVFDGEQLQTVRAFRIAGFQNVRIAGRKGWKDFDLPFLQFCNPAILQSLLLAAPALRRIQAKLRRRRRVTGKPGSGELQHTRHLALAEDRVAENLVVHVPAFGREPGVFDVPDDLDLVHAVARAGGADDVLFDHHAAHVVRAEREAELPHFPALRDPRRLQVVEVVEHNPRRRQRAQVVDAGRLGAPELRVRGLIAPGNERREPTGLVLQRTEPQQMLEALVIGLDRAVHHRRGRA